MTLDPESLAYLQLPASLPEAAGLVEGSYLKLSAWLAGRLPQIGTLLVAVTYSLYGRILSEALRRTASRWPFPLRLSVFVAVVGFGAGLIIASVAPLVTDGLRAVGTSYLVPAILCAFIVIGILAERSGRI